MLSMQRMPKSTHPSPEWVRGGQGDIPETQECRSLFSKPATPGRPHHPTCAQEMPTEGIPYWDNCHVCPQARPTKLQLSSPAQGPGAGGQGGGERRAPFWPPRLALGPPRAPSFSHQLLPKKHQTTFQGPSGLGALTGSCCLSHLRCCH